LPSTSKQTAAKMMKSKIKAWMSAANTYAYHSSLFVISFMPLGWSLQAARRIGRLRYRSRRPLIEPEKQLVLVATSQEIETWLDQSFQLATCEDLEALLFKRLTRESLATIIELRGLENLKVALDGGKGAILYSGHIRGCFTFFTALGALGHRVNITGKGMGWGHSGAEQWFLERRNDVMEKNFGCRFLKMEDDNLGVAVKATLALRHNEIVTLAIDKTVSEKAANVKFLNGTKEFPCGPALLGQATGAPLLSFYVHREHEWQPQIAEIGPVFYASGDVQQAVQHCALQLEQNILKRPAAWYSLWHPKWKLAGKRAA
jgi:KDO2-lipid IV(A) lauroyltransferase